MFSCNIFRLISSGPDKSSKEDITANDKLEIVSESDVTGPYLIIAEGGKNIFVTGQRLHISPTSP